MSIKSYYIIIILANKVNLKLDKYPDIKLLLDIK
jgi:hypothetical protein